MDTDLTPVALVALRKILHFSEIDTRRMASATGMTPSQIMVLREVAQSDWITPGAVAAQLRFGQATVTNIVDRLVAAGLVTRQRGAQDKRQVILQVTDEGRERLRSSPDPMQLRFSERYPLLPAWEQAMILAALERLGGLLGAMPGHAEPPTAGRPLDTPPDQDAASLPVSFDPAP